MKDSINPKASAAYNFVGLSDGVVPSPLDERLKEAAKSAEEKETVANVAKEYERYLNEEGIYNGEILLHIKTETPLFIGGAGETSFSPAGNPIIPGSSLRGLVKSLFKIVTAGAMRAGEDFTDRHMYYRCIMAPKQMPQLEKLHAEYISRMIRKENGKEYKRTQPGFLIRCKTDQTYYICPAKCQNISEKDYAQRFPNSSEVRWDIQNQGAYCFTGRGKGKEYVRYIHGADWREESRIPVPPDVIRDYMNDQNRRGVDLVNVIVDENKNTAVMTDKEASDFAKRKDIDRVAPCFYIREEGTITAFGHGRSFRIPYKHAISSLIPPEIKDKTTIDFSDAVFGRKGYWASRIFFEDAESEDSASLLKTSSTVVLAQPNPTSFQLYMKQPTGIKYADHWDTKGARIRGYKLYWHNDVKDNSWCVTEDTGNEKMRYKITPIARGQKFIAKIRFSRLSKIELGALCKVFNIGQNTRYKIGQGKSLGLGSISLIPSLWIEGTERYKKLFAGDTWLSAAEKNKESDFIEAFEKYMQTKTGKEYQNSMEELEIMLSWENTDKPNWSKRIATMNLDMQKRTNNPFIQRLILPTVKEVTE